jgi:hypothetical protein
VVANRSFVLLVKVESKIAVGVGIAVPERLIGSVDAISLSRLRFCCNNVEETKIEVWLHLICVERTAEASIRVILDC